MPNRANFEALGIQIGSLERADAALRSGLENLDRKVDYNSRETQAKIDQGLAAIHAKLDERARTPWGVIYTALGLLLTFCITIGGLAYLPIKSDMTRIEAQMLRNEEARIRVDWRLFDDGRDMREKMARMEGFMQWRRETEAKRPQ